MVTFVAATAVAFALLGTAPDDREARRAAAHEHYQAGILAAEAGKNSLALNRFSECLAADVAYVPCYAKAAIAHAALGHVESAYLYYQFVSQIDPLSLEKAPLQQIAAAYRARARDSKEAIDTLRAQGKDALTRGQFGSAVMAFDRCIKMDAACAACYRNNAMAHQRLGDSALAEVYYHLYLHITPEADDADAVRRVMQVLRSRKAAGEA